MPRLRFLAVIFAVLCVTAASALAATPGNYVGRTADHRRVSFTVSGKQVRAFRFQTRFTCSNHTGFVASAKFPKINISGRRFSGAFTGSGGALSTTIKGTFSGRKASGTIRRRARYNSARKLSRTGHLVCSSTARFTAKH